MDVIDDLPDTDAMRFARRSGVDLERLGALGSTGDRFEQVMVADPALRSPSSTDPVEVLLAQQGSVLAVPVHLNGSRRNPRFTLARWVPTPPGSRTERLAAMVEGLDPNSMWPTVLPDMGVAIVPAAPTGLRRPHSPRTLADWYRCCEEVRTSIAELDAASMIWGRLVVPPLVAAPPPTQTSRESLVDRFGAELTSVFGPGLVFAPFPVLASR